MPSRERKAEYFARMHKLLDTYSKCLIVSADHVGSLQFANIRIALRGKAVVLMGKNTMMRRCLTLFTKDHPGHPYEKLIPYLLGNVGLIFTNGDLGDVRAAIDDNRVGAPAKAGVVAECDVTVTAGPTGCDPGQTSWFQALNLPTKISRGQIEIVSDQLLCKKGERVGVSEAALLQKLGYTPFTYGLKLEYVYSDGNLFSAAVLDLTDEELTKKFTHGISCLAALGLGAGLPSQVTLVHSIKNATDRLIAICAMTGYSFEQMSEWNQYLNTAEPEPAAEEAEAPAEE